MTYPPTTGDQRPRQLQEGASDDMSFEELIKELTFDRMIERGLVDAERGRTISHEEMGRRIAGWKK